MGQRAQPSFPRWPVDRPQSQVTGDAPKTERLWFRWNMANNLLLSAGDVAVDEWKAKQLEAETEAAINAEKKLRQFVWALPYVPSSLDAERLTSNRVGQRQTQYPRAWLRGHAMDHGQDRLGKVRVALGGDRVAWRRGERDRLRDRGRPHSPRRRGRDRMDVEQAIMTALSTMRERFGTWDSRGTARADHAARPRLDRFGGGKARPCSRGSARSMTAGRRSIAHMSPARASEFQSARATSILAAHEEGRRSPAHWRAVSRLAISDREGPSNSDRFGPLEKLVCTID